LSDRSHVVTACAKSSQVSGPVNTMGVVRLMKPGRTALSSTQSGSPATIPVTAA
jgi:hypothetical protein